jgi:nuclear GTP-binding protein
MGCRAQAAEAKARRKEEKKNLRAQQKSALGTSGRGGGSDDGLGGEDCDNAEGEEGHFDGVATLGGPTKSSSKSREGGIGAPAASGGTSAPASSTEGANIDGAPPPPPLLNPDLPHLAAVLDKADVVIEVLDARDPLAHRSSALEARVASKGGQQKLLLVLNKIGACVTHLPLVPDALHVRADR